MIAYLPLAARSAWARRLTLALMVGAVALSTLIMLAAERLRHDVRLSFSNALSGTDLVVGARGSPTQLILHTVFHIGQPVQAVSLSRIETIARLPQVAWVVPIALGDSFAGHPVVAADAAFFEHVKVGDRQPLRFAEGRAFATAPEAVLGAQVASRTGLKVGDRITLSHGSGALTESSHEDRPMVVAGILAASGSPVDRTVMVSLESWQMLHAGWMAGVRPRAGSTTAGAAPPAANSTTYDPASQRPPTVSAALVGLHSRAAVFSVQRAIQAGQQEPLTAALPGVTLDELWRGLGAGEAALRLLTGLVALASLAGLVSVMLAGLESRRRELAILRSLGASPLALAALILAETLIASLAGVILGMVLGAATLALASSWVQTEFGISLGAGLPAPGEWLLIAAIILAGMLAALLPAWRAWRLSLADGLAPRT